MEKKTKINGGKTNQNVNIPTMWMHILKAKKGDEVTIELDVKKNRVIIKFDKD